MIADGNPAVVRGINKVGLQRRGFTEEDLKALRECYKAIYMRKLNVQQALEAIEANDTIANNQRVQQLVEFTRTSERGIIR